MRRVPKALLLVTFLASCSAEKAPVRWIQLAPGVTLGDTTGDGALAGGAFVSPRLPLGYVVTTPWGEPNLPALFDTAGRFVGLLGRSGDGPGEYRRAQSMVTLGDSLMIVDNALSRATVLDESLRVARSFRIEERPWKLLELADGTFLSSVGIFQRREPFTHLSRDGAAIRRIGAMPEAEGNPIHLLARAPDGTVWTARGSERLELIHYDRSLDRIGELVPERDWFPPTAPFARPSPTTAPPPGVTGIWVDAAGRLWVVGFSADPEWVEGLGPERTGEGGIRYHPITDRRLAYDGILDVYDPASGALLASHREDHAWVDVVEPGVLLQAEQTAEGWTRARLWTARWRDGMSAAP